MYIRTEFRAMPENGAVVVAQQGRSEMTAVPLNHAQEHDEVVAGALI
jgi:hypothetical protein